MSNTLDSKVESLDMDDAVVLPFYFKLVNEEKGKYKHPEGETLYSMPVNMVDLVGYFRTTIKREKGGYSDECSTEATALPILPIWHAHPSEARGGFYINTKEQYDFVHKYLMYWLANPTKSAYVKKEPIQTDKMDQLIINKFDRELIDEFIDKKRKLLSPEEQKRLADTPIENKVFIIETLRPLLNLTIKYLQLDCLGLKLTGYIAVTIRHTSMDEISRVSGDPIFINMQKEACDAWVEENKDIVAKMARSNTTGAGQTNPLEEKKEGEAAVGGGAGAVVGGAGANADDAKEDTADDDAEEDQEDDDTMEEVD